jgi:hypothetical protein
VGGRKRPRGKHLGRLQPLEALPVIETQPRAPLLATVFVPA